MALSPMMEHYLTIKENYKDCIVFYRLGDFYEMFFEDAIKASEILGLTLTGRDCGLKERAPMCGVPFHAADLYISKLVAAGEKVAICEQMTEPNGKNLVEREIVRIVSAGTVTNDELIDAKTNNYLLSLYLTKHEAAIAWADITTGDFYAESFICNDVLLSLINEMVRISPVEIIANRNAIETLSETPVFAQGVLPKISVFTESEFDEKIAQKTLKEQLNVKDLTVFGFKSDKDVSVIPAGALVAYLKETQKNALYNINTVNIVDGNEFMLIDQNAVRNLELTRSLREGKRYGSLLWVLDKTKTSMGARLLQNWILSPLTDKDEIDRRLNGVESLYNDTVIRKSVSDVLSSVKDIGRISGKISNGNVNPKDCIALSYSLSALPNIRFQLLGIRSDFIEDIVNDFYDYGDVVSLIEKAIYVDRTEETDEKRKIQTKKTVRYIKEGYNAELDELRSLASGGVKEIDAIEAKEREKTGIKTLKVSYNRVFGYYIEITNSFKDRVPFDYVRKQTLANAERYVTQELKELEEKVLTATEKAEILDAKLFAEIKEQLIERAKSWARSASSAARSPGARRCWGRGAAS